MSHRIACVSCPTETVCFVSHRIACVSCPTGSRVFRVPPELCVSCPTGTARCVARPGELFWTPSVKVNCSGRWPRSIAPLLNVAKLVELFETVPSRASSNSGCASWPPRPLDFRGKLPPSRVEGPATFVNCHVCKLPRAVCKLPRAVCKLPRAVCKLPRSATSRSTALPELPRLQPHRTMGR